ncbi:MAG: hypothetical protein Q7S05_00275 [bacterium]|nr:hypothetical protein [bacterium]
MKQLQKGFISPLLLALVALIVIGGGAYVYTQNKQANQPIVEQASDWKTYTNSQYGFSLQYPNDMPPTPVHNRWSEIISMISFGTDATGVNINMITTPADITNCLVAPQNLLPKTYSVSEIKTVPVNGVPFLSYIISSSDRFAQTQYYRALQDGVCFSIEQRLSTSLTSEAQKIQSQYNVLWAKTSAIVQSFRFITPNQNLVNINTTNSQIAGWKTCVNTKYGYEVKYPPTWKVWKPGAPEARLASCSENLVITSFSPNLPEYVSQINIEVTDQERLRGTVHEGSKSIDDYLARQPLILQYSPKVKETMVNDERLIWLEGNRLLAFHNSSLFEFRIYNVDSATLNNFISTFKFTALNTSASAERVCDTMGCKPGVQVGPNGGSASQTADWKTYTNSQHGYTIQYPTDVKVDLSGVGWDGTKWINYSPSDSISSTTDWYASTCITLSKGDWYIHILADAGFSGVPCGSTGTSATNRPGNDTVVVNGKQIAVIGRIESDRSAATFNFSLNDKVSIEYGIVAKTTLSEQDYQVALNALHAVLSTLKPIQDFTPVLPPPNGRG